jgi:hypothetical protein
MLRAETASLDPQVKAQDAEFNRPRQIEFMRKARAKRAAQRHEQHGEWGELCDHHYLSRRDKVSISHWMAQSGHCIGRGKCAVNARLLGLLKDTANKGRNGELTARWEGTFDQDVEPSGQSAEALHFCNSLVHQTRRPREESMSIQPFL